MGEIIVKTDERADPFGLVGDAFNESGMWKGSGGQNINSLGRENGTIFMVCSPSNLREEGEFGNICRSIRLHIKGR